MEIEQLIQKQRSFYQTNRTKKIEFRARALAQLRKAVIAYENKISKALAIDLCKSETESFMTEIGMVLSELTTAQKNLRKWTADKKVRTPLSQFPSQSFIHQEPYGVVLIMAPWNYPFQLAILPVVGAIAAGNCCIIKPSAYAKETSQVMAEMISEYFPKEYIAVVEGGRKENTKLLEQKFDYIFFTGGVTVGKLVMEKAAANLTPVTLELGGKSPCIVTKDANIKLAAKRIVFGKFLNAGQTCVSVDYVLADETIKDKLLAAIQYYIKQMYGTEPLKNELYGKIINEKHFNRVLSLIEADKIVCGGKSDAMTLKIEPTVLRDITAESACMQEEIFGPVLPVIGYENLDEAENFVLQYDKPLSCYIFTTSKFVEKRLLNNLSFGGGCINDTVIHLASEKLPFGGVGASGMGSYHGKKSFETFSHAKSVIKKANWLDLPMRYQPYTKKKERYIRLFLK